LSGEHGSQFALINPDRVIMFDDFLGDVVADEWNFVEGSDHTTSDGAIVESVNGVFRLTGGDSAGTVAADAAELNSALGWKANQGGLTFEARIKLASIASVSCFIGFTDTKSLEQAIYASGTADGITTDATDAVGVFFDTAMATDNWWLAGVANDVDAATQDTKLVPVAAVYETFRIVIDIYGTATFYRASAAEPANFKQIGTPMVGAVTPTVALTPSLLIRPKSAVAGKTMDIDYVKVTANRA
jgi:hypothetical protein